MFDYISLANLSYEYLILLVLNFLNINNPYNYNESPHIYNQCCCKKVLMFDYISLTVQIEVTDS